MNTLLPHRVIREAERLLREGIAFNQVDPGFNAPECALAALHRASGSILMTSQLLGR